MNNSESIITVFIAQPNGPATVTTSPNTPIVVVISDAEDTDEAEDLPPLKFAVSAG